ncbi:hypothetical protein SS50377_21725 [Spironucleus salmonicida]|uniref:Uncharacterized protein n=1 Tax=Spironucleus salmonicida TaxID=348837 RepID=A0A9P8LXI3_9EUKA|nr:hypothetical protein SS50377_21725 [Spironucleus salmonicida]
MYILQPYTETAPQTTIIFRRVFQLLVWKVLTRTVSAMPQKMNLIQRRSIWVQGLFAECPYGDDGKRAGTMRWNIYSDDEVNLIGRGRLRAVWFACWEESEPLGQLSILLYQYLCSQFLRNCQKFYDLRTTFLAICKHIQRLGVARKMQVPGLWYILHQMNQVAVKCAYFNILAESSPCLRLTQQTSQGASFLATVPNAYRAKQDSRLSGYAPGGHYHTVIRQQLYASRLFRWINLIRSLFYQALSIS